MILTAVIDVITKRNLTLQTKQRKGETRIPAGLSVWQHELETANALATAGFIVEFLKTKTVKNTKSPDIAMAGFKWEIKSLIAYKLSEVERNLKRAYHQSESIIFDSHRMGKLPDKSIQKELEKQFKLTKKVKRLLFINRKREVIDISKLA